MVQDSGQTHPALEMTLEAIRTGRQDPLLREAMRRAGELYWEERKGRVPSAHEAYVREWSGKIEPVAGLYAFALGLWRLTKGAYLFDPDLFQELVQTPLDRVPREVLERLPEPAPLLLFPEPLPPGEGWRVRLHGTHVVFSPRPWTGKPPLFWGVAWFTVRGEEGEERKRFVGWGLALDEEDPEKAHLKGVRGVSRAFGLPEPTEAEVAHEVEILRAMTNLALYLCQEQPDLGGVAPRPPAEPKRTREGPRIFPPQEALLIPTGWRWGKALRLARREREERESRTGTGRSPVPHVRRAHWHTYLTGEGSRKDPAKAIPRLRWVPATLVGRKVLEAMGLTLEDLPATVRPVEAAREKEGKEEEK